MINNESKHLTFFPILLRWNTFMPLLTNDEAGKLLKSMFSYYIDGETPDFADNVKLQVVWCDVESWLDTSKDNYKSKIEKASEAGRRSAAKRKGLTGVNECQQMLTIAKEKQCNSNTIVKEKQCNEKDKIARHAYGSYGNVWLSEEELKTLKSEFPGSWSQWVERVSGYCEQTGSTYNNYVATIRNWAQREQKETGNTEGDFVLPFRQTL